MRIRAYRRVGSPIPIVFRGVQIKVRRRLFTISISSTVSGVR